MKPKRGGLQLIESAAAVIEQFLATHLTLVCCAVFLLVFTVRIAFVSLILGFPETQLAEMEQLARNLLLTGSLSDPYALPTGPSAHHAPLYPALLSMVFHWFGTGRQAAVAAGCMNLAFASAQYAVLPLLARIAAVPVSIGVSAALIGVVPFRVLTELRWETPLNGFVLVIFTIAAVYWSRHQSTRGAAVSAVTGLLWGIAMIITPMCLPVAAACTALAAYQGVRSHRPSVARNTLLVIVCAAVGVSPWILRNYAALGGFIFVRSNFPLEFQLSNHDGVSPLAIENYGDRRDPKFEYFYAHHPFSSGAEARRVQQMGELEYNRAKLREALTWCRTHPSKFMALTSARMYMFWRMPSPAQPVKSVVIFGITMLALGGMTVLWQVNRWTAIPFAAVLLGFPLPYYFVQVDSRYRYPMEWAFAFLGAYLIFAAASAGVRRMAAHTTE